MMVFPQSLRGRYAPEKRLGGGGTSVVWAAFDRLLNRDVAVKVLRPDRTPDEGRLLEEFALLSSLNHPGVVTVRDVGMAGDALFLSSDLIDGQTLDHWLATGPSDSERRNVATALLSTLGWLHRQGVVHADIKPANVVVDPTAHGGWPTLIDFGLAGDITGQALMGGTPRFMAPELRDGAAPSVASDLFALGRLIASMEVRGQRWASLCRALCAERPQERPQDAITALRQVVASQPEASQRLGSRGVVELWQSASEPIARSVLASDGLHRVSMTTAGDLWDVLHALRCRLQLHGHHVLMPPPTLLSQGPKALFERIADCMAGDAPEVTPKTSTRPDDHKEALDIFCDHLIARFRRLPAQRWTLLIAEPQRLGSAGAYALARLIESGALRSVVIASSNPSWKLPRGVESPFARHALASMSQDQVDELMRMHEVPVDVPAPLVAAVGASARGGARAVRDLLNHWITATALVPNEHGGWTWQPGKAAHALDNQDMDDAWHQRWNDLEVPMKQALVWVESMGGAATRSDLEAGDVAPATWQRLLQRDWLEGRDGGVALSTGNRRRLHTGHWDGSRPQGTVRQRAVELLAGRTSPPSMRARATHLHALGRPLEAISAWMELSRQRQDALCLGEAADAALNACNIAAERGASDLLWVAEEAVKLCLVASDGDGCRTAVANTDRIVGANATHDILLRTEVIKARAHAYLAEPDDALQAAERARSLAKQPRVLDLLDPDRRARLLCDLELAYATALNQRGRPDAAAESLERAAELAKTPLDDPHTLGRVSNNLGIAQFNLGRFEEAAEAWATAAVAKDRCGDMRGKRIAWSNQGLALRELGRLESAARLSRKALAIAQEHGDRPGRVMGHLSIAQLWLDMGKPDRADEALIELDGMTVASALMRADREVVKLRCAIALGRFEAAVAIAERELRDAVDGGLATIIAELWPLCWWLHSRNPAAAPTPPDLPREVQARVTHGMAWRAACACAAAHAGTWDVARQLLSEAAAQLPKTHGVAPGNVVALALGLHATDMLGDRRDAWVDCARRTLKTRYWEQVALTGKPPSTEALLRCAAAVGLEGALPSERSDPDFEIVARELLEHRAPMIAVSTSEPVYWNTRPHPGASEFARSEVRVRRELATVEGCLDAVRTLVDAARCAVFVVDDGVKEMARTAPHSDDVMRLGRFIRAVATGSQSEWFAKHQDRIEVALVPLAQTEPGASHAVLLLRFEHARYTADALISLLGPLMEWLAVTVDRRRCREALDDMTRAYTTLKAEHDAAQQQHVKEVTSLRHELDQSRTQLRLRHAYSNIIHHSSGMKRVLNMVDRLAERPVNALIVGESGVGKEVIARAMHAHSPRSSGPFVAENCGAVPADLFESVFFGHLKGAFTGAHRASQGLFEAARGGTLFLDELGEMPLNQQVKLLRVLQERRFRPVGATTEREADFRLVAATNRDLADQIATGKFREDLFYRVAVVTVGIPPLRERKADIIPLARHFLKQHRTDDGTELKLSVQAANALVNYAWPGNVRELDNEMLRASVLCDEAMVQRAHLSPRIANTDGSRPRSMAHVATDDADLEGHEPLHDAVARLEARLIRHALRDAAGKKLHAARTLGLSRPGLDAKLERYGIDAAAIKHAARAAKERTS